MSEQKAGVFLTEAELWHLIDATDPDAIGGMNLLNAPIREKLFEALKVIAPGG